jgi:heptosyltransferase I
MTSFKSILVIKLGSIGDVLHTLPAVAALRASFPEARIDWLVEKKARVLLEGNPALHSIIEVDTRSWRRTPLSGATRRQMWKVLRDLRSAHYDLAIDFQGLWKSAAFAFFSGARQRLGFDATHLKEPGCRFFYHQRVNPQVKSKHIIQKNNDLVSACGAKLKEWVFTLPYSEQDEAYVADRLREFEVHDFVIVNPGGGWPTKNWPARNYGELSQRIQRQLGLRCLLTWGPGEEPLVLEAREDTAGTIPLATFPTTLLQFIALARRARLFTGGDTGPMHLAAACGTPVVAILGPTDPSRNGPWSPLDEVVYHPLPCGPCYKRSCEVFQTRCLKEISVDEVFEAVARRLKRTEETD